MSDLPADAVPYQFQELFRVHNVSCDTIADGVVVRQYLPVDDRVQEVDWVMLADTDPRIESAEIRTWGSAGSKNSYVNWVLGPLEPNDCVQVGFVCGMRFAPDETDGGWRPRATMPPFRQEWRDRLLNLSSLCQFLPVRGLGEYLGDPTVLAPLEEPDLSNSDVGDQWELWQAEPEAATEPQSVIGMTAELTLGWWNDLDAAVVAVLDPAEWAAQSRARRIAVFVNTVVNTQLYGDTSSPDTELTDDEGGFLNGTQPGSRDWPLILRQGLKIAVESLGTILSATAGGSLGALQVAAWEALGEALSALYPLNPEVVPCRCSERAYQMLWLLRLARIPCRELGGTRLTAARASSPTRLPAGQTVGHRMVEAWDGALREWIPIDTTSHGVGPDIAPSDFLTRVRGLTSPWAPLVWGYSTEVFKAELDRTYNLLRDSSPEAAPSFGPGQEELSGPLYHGLRYLENRDWVDDLPWVDGAGWDDLPIESHEENLRASLRWMRTKFAIEEHVLDYESAGRLRDLMVAIIGATTPPGGLGYFPLQAMVLSAVPVPAAENGLYSIDIATGQPLSGPNDPPPPATISTPAFCGAVLCLCGPQIAIDREFWFTQRFLALPDPAQVDPTQLTYERLQADGGLFGVPSPAGVLTVRYGARSSWAWSLVAGALYFAGSGESPTSPLAVPAANPGHFPAVLPLAAMLDFGAPLPLAAPFPDSDFIQRWFGNTAGLLEAAREPARLFNKIEPLLSGAPSDVRLRLTRFGDLVATD